ncbi:MAG: flagellar hook capping FlgD N-terminal domain-containing protein [Syntrophomonadaceae bacterium]|nr:flagellar hook capping FlgD N-terminal domain-containing protein [Syntrophomonadaceae bacterium]MDD3023900.1 flagellar hook capping FlgD N-terminal domain-containing protein [Syntrophomonadaceae bacterium]
MATSEVRYEPAPWLKTESTTSTTKTNSPNSSLDKDAFLKLLLTELRYQDPMEPVKDKEFMAQMASFSSLEQMTNLNTGFGKLSSNITENLLPGLMLQQSSTMIGREVTYTNPEDATASLTGVIESALIKDGVSYYVIDGKEIAMSKISKIGEQSTSIDQAVLVEILYRLDLLTSHLIPGEDD